MAKTQQELPSAGGAYIRQADGSLRLETDAPKATKQKAPPAKPGAAEEESV